MFRVRAENTEGMAEADFYEYSDARTVADLEIKNGAHRVTIIDTKIDALRYEFDETKG